MPEIKAGRYQIQDELGRGAMGVVYKAFDPTIGRTVAVKTMRLTEASTGMSHDELIKRFQIETQAAGRLTHPNIVVVYDAGEEGGLFYITMEFIQGRSLQALIDQKQVFPLPRVVRVIEQAGAALDFAHQNSVVHRDIKPANLMLTGDDIVKVTDFGTAKILAKGSQQTGAIIGTPSYMSPEQVKGKPVDGRSDIFSLGVILYELVTGEKPFPGQNVTTVIYKIVNEEPIDPRELDSSIHPGLAHVVTRALHKDSDARYQNARELVEDLRNYRNLGGPGSSDSVTVVMPGRDRPQAVLDAIAKSKAAAAARDAEKALAAASPDSGAVPRPTPRPTTLPPLTSYIPKEEVEKRKSSAGMWMVMIVLLAAVGAGGYFFLWPQLQELLGGPPVQQTQPAVPTGSDTAVPPPADSGAPPTKTPDTRAAASGPAQAPAEPPPAEVLPAATDTASEKVKSDFEKQIERAGFAKKLRVAVAGNEVTVSGTLTREEYNRFRQRASKLPGKWKLRDRIQLAAAAPTKAPATPAEGDERPRTAPGRGEVEIIAEGATAVLTGPKGETKTDKTPTRFEDLLPGRYTLDVTRPGHRPEKRILNVRAGNISSVDIVMQALESSVRVNSRPVGADVYVNGDRHPERTPTTVLLPPGDYSFSVRKQGYQSYSQTIKIQGDEVHRLDAVLTPGAESGPPPQTPAPQTQPPPAPAAPMGTVDVRTVPPNADILVNGKSTGRRANSKLQLPPGKYRITLFLPSYQLVTVDIVVEEGKTVNVYHTLTPQ